MSEQTDFRPSAGLATLKQRARMLQDIRAFFDARGLLEVETPILSNAGATDPHIDSLQSQWQDGGQPVYLHTSPEYAMKRLLAAGSGPIYQISRVFRYGERGRQHHPEFTMLEWYQPGFDHLQLLSEVDELVRMLLAGHVSLQTTLRWTYREAWQQTLGVDPFMLDTAHLQQLAGERGIDVTGLGDDRDSWLQLLMTHCIEPALPRATPVFIYDFPASQAALARIREDDPPVAERFELYINGMELANGFHELTDAAEQRRRFESDLARRQQMSKAAMPLDEKLLAALSHMPDCAGVAVGVERLLMVALGADKIDEVMAFVLDT